MSRQWNSPLRVAPFETPLPRSESRIRAFCRTWTGRVLLGTIACWLLAFIFCRFQFWRDPHSFFFDSDAAYELRYTRERQAQARLLIDAAGSDWDLSPKPSVNPVMCAGIVTVKRKGIQYLNETVGSLLVGLTDEERSALNVQVFFADLDPTIHPDWDSEWLSVLDRWYSYNISSEQREILEGYHEKQRVRAKAIFDYVYLLDQCYNKTNAPYIGIFEDDVIFADSWLAKSFAALAEIRQKVTPYLYLRLFWTDVMLGWDKEIDSWYTNPIFNYILALGVSYAVALGLRLHLKRSRPDLDTWPLMVLWGVTVPAFITLFYMIGRNSLWPMQGLQRMDTKGCCTQALIFPRSQVQSLTNMLLQEDPNQTDLMMEKYANKMGLARYALAPQLVQHVGLVSSRGTKRKNSQTNWAFYFEDFDAKTLKREHSDLARWAIWRATHDGSALVQPG